MDIQMQETETAQKILVVEDEIPDAILITKELGKILPDSQVTAVRSIRDAYNTLKTNTFDLILLDLNLPDGFGPNTVKEVRKFNRRTPVVVLTTMGNDLTVQEALKMGADRVMLKSQISDESFEDIIKQHIEIEEE